MNLPNFLVIGAMKAGTTSLYAYLNAHPQVFTGRSKELNFFTVEHNYDRGLEWYSSQFEGVTSEIAIGEASTNYAKYPEYEGVAERIAHHTPTTKLIYVIRHPIDRMRSQYMQHLARGREHREISQALLTNPSYVQISSYAMQIEQYLEHFPREQLLVIKSDDLKNRRADTVRGVYRFIGVDDSILPDAVEQEYYKTADKREYKPMARMMRSLPGVGVLTKRAPQGLKHANRRYTTRNVALEKAVIPPTVWAEMEDRVRADVGRLYQYVEPPFDGWGIA